MIILMGVAGSGKSSVGEALARRLGWPFRDADDFHSARNREKMRRGVPLEKIGLVLRHRGIDTTAHYAKADVTLLKQIAQPWPETL